MKNIIITTLCLISSGALAQQWQTNGVNISNTNSGNVGIGTVSPTRKLSVNHASESTLGFFVGEVEKAYIGASADDDGGKLRFFTQSPGGTPLERVRIAANGYVGIGLTPESRLDVLLDNSAGNRRFRSYGNGGVRLQRSADTEGWSMSYGFLSNNGSTDFGGFGAWGTGNSGFKYYFIGQGYTSPLVVVNGDGTVGIGTTSPTKKLEIVGENNTVRIHKGSGYAPLEFSSGGSGNHNNGRVSLSTYGEGGSADLIHSISNWSGNYYYRFGASDGNYNVVRIARGGSGGNGLAECYGYVDVFGKNQKVDVRLHANGISFFNGGNVGIGTTTPDSKLTVKGTIHTQEVKVDLNGSVAPDFVFEEDYDLPALAETAAYIKVHKHLPGIPSAAEMEENGLDLKEMNLKLLQKVEELTLHLIEMKEENQNIKKVNTEIKLELDELRASVSSLKE